MAHTEIKDVDVILIGLGPAGRQVAAGWPRQAFGLSASKPASSAASAPTGAVSRAR